MKIPTGGQESLSDRNGKIVFADRAAAMLLSGRLAELLAPDRHGWEKVKGNVSRTVYRGEIGSQPIYLKYFHSRSVIHRLARRLGFYDARCEMEFSRYLNSQGISTVPALASMCDGKIEWLATRAVAPAEPADQWHARQLARGGEGLRAIRKVIVALAEIVGRMHRAGVLHRDLHCGNILVRTDSHPPRLVVTDLHRVSRRRWLSRRARAANLAQLFHDRYDFTTRTDRLRFLKHYMRASNAEGTLRGWQRLVEQFAHRHTRKQRTQRDRRILGENQYFTRLKLGGGWRAHVVLSSKRRLAGSKAADVTFRPEEWKISLANPADLLDPTMGEIVKDSRSSLVIRRRLGVGPHDVEVFVKQSRRKQPWKILLDCFRPARSVRAFQLGHQLLTRRIATALPLAALERRLGPLLTDSILITEAVQAPDLNEFLRTHLGESPCGEPSLTAAEQRHLAREVLRQLGRLLQRLHDNNYAHRDLKASNLLIRWSPEAPPEAILVDLDGLTRMPWLTIRRRFQGLMRLNVSLLKCPAVNRAGRLRMLMGYLRRPGMGRIDFKRYWRVLDDWSGKKLDRQIRSRRRRQKLARRPG